MQYLNLKKALSLAFIISLLVVFSAFSGSGVSESVIFDSYDFQTSSDISIETLGSVTESKIIFQDGAYFILTSLITPDVGQPAIQTTDD